MIAEIENGLLNSDLDAGFFDLLNVALVTPIPSNLAATDDPRLSDARPPLDGSVTDAKVAAAAGIVQSKLNLNGLIPAAWLGNTSTTAARGDLVEYLSNKGQPNGYAALDGSGKVPPAQLPSDVGVGTVTSVALTLPAQFSVTGSPVTSSGTLAAAWASVPDGSWFGNPSGSTAAPTFQTTPLPVGLIPSLDASKIISGTLNPARLPAAVGVGASHAPGSVPDPGASGTATDYLARDMTYKALPSIGPSYQPTLANPILTSTPVAGGANVSVGADLAKPSVLYKIDAGTYATMPSYVFVPTGSTISVYSAKAGYNNSSVVTLTI
jgi:hypothetical protein